jgi:glycosyltransferase involved in cell wall biosynthesis
MTTPQVSVIIPTCNRARLLPVAIRSVLAQTFGNFELIIVDDASEDSIDDVVKAFQDRRVRWITHEERLGGGAARNTGIRNSGGEFVAFLDDDDEWYPQKLARQMALLLRSSPNVGGVYTGYEAIDRETGKLRARQIPRYRGDLSSELLKTNCIGSTSSVLLRRQCLNDVGMFDESLPSFQDYDLWIRISRAYQFDSIAECLLKYYLHSNKIWTNPEAIRAGLDILVERYGASASFRRRCGHYYLSAAAQFCESGEGGKARQSLRRAILLHPFNARHYLYLFLSLLGRSTYRKVQHMKAIVTARRRWEIGKNLGGN